MFWKKVNRGLILGCALLIFLVGFIIVKEVQFKKEAPLVQERAEAYIEAFANMQLSVGGQIGKVVPDSVKEAQLAKLDAVFEEYWYGNLPENEITFTSAARLRQNYATYLSDKLQARFLSFDVHVLPSSVSVRRDGPNRAVVSLSVEIKTDFEGEGNAFFSGDYRDGTVYDDYNQELSDSDSLEPIKLYSGVMILNLTFEMQRVNGTWRVVGQQGYGYMTSTEPKEG